MEIQPDNADRRLVLNQALNALEEMQGRLNEAERSKTEPIAVIGMGCRFPGGADTPEAFWQLLRNGGNAVREVPADRWDVSGYFDPDPEAPGKIYTRFGGFLDQVDKFDSQFFGISPREALSLDPQQRLVLEVGWEALERAGQSPAELLDSRTAVFIGIGSSDYFLLQTKNSDPARIDAYTGSGGGLCFAAGRLSYFLGLQGPSMIIDTACSSSLVAVHQACQSLRTRESNLALAGGVNLMLSPDLFIYLCKIKALAADGFCKAFDAAADGLVRGEGCGVVVLKRLADAVSDGDNILALIAGSAVNQDGRSSGLTVPNGVAQQALIREALANARKEPAQVSFVETHGTGTSLGDPIEANALGAVLGMGRRKDQPLVIGSVKTNVGHLEAAAGIAGLIKAVLALQHKEIPPNLHFKHLNPEINVNEFPILVPTKAIPWTSASGTRIAGVSSFGLSGTNAHVILEEAPSRAPLSAGDSRPTHVLCLSAKNPAALKQLSARYEDYLATQPMTPVSDVCYTANTGRAHFKHRLAIVNSSLEELRARLLDFGAGNESVCVSSGEVKGILPPKVAFLFTGQGGQYVNMGRALDESEPAFRQIVDRCDELLRPHLPKSLRSVLYPQPGEITPLDETAYTHVAMFAVQYGLAQLWRSWGVQPGMVMGHSVGEIVAATVAGSMSLEDGLMIMRERGRLMQSLPATGMMASLLAGEERVAAALAPYRDRVAIAAVNGPESTVISGERTAMQEILHTLEAEGIKTKPLKVSNSFHSPLVEPVLEEFEKAAARAVYRPPQTALFSSMRLEMVGERNLLDAAYWRYNLRHTVRFSEAMRAVYEQGYRVFLEIGPSPILVSMGSQCVPIGESVWLASLKEGRDDWQQILESLAILYVHGAKVSWAGFDRAYPRHRISLPTYPFQRERYWIQQSKSEPPTYAARIAQQGIKQNPLLGFRLHLAHDSDTYVWENEISTMAIPFLADHRVEGEVVVPAAAFVEMGMAAIADAFGPSCLILSEIKNEAVLVLSEGQSSTVQVILTRSNPAEATFRVFSRPRLGNTSDKPVPGWTLNASGRVSYGPSILTSTDRQPLDLEAIRNRCPQELAGTAFYRSLNEKGNQWGPRFQGIDYLWRGHGEALSRVLVPQSLRSEVHLYHFHPALADACGHVLVAAMPFEKNRDDRGGAFVGGGIDEVRYYRKPEGVHFWAHARLRDSVDQKSNILRGDVRLFDETGQLLAEVMGIRLWYLDHGDQIPSFEKWFYEPRWEPKPLQKRQQPVNLIVDDSAGTWLVFADTKAVGEALVNFLGSRQRKCVMVFPGEKYERLDYMKFCVRPGESQDLRDLLEATLGTDGSSCSGIIHLWSVDAPPVEKTTLASLEKAQAQGCASIMHLVQELSRLKIERLPRLWLITQGTQAAGERGSLTTLASATLWGFGRSIALEHSELWGGMVDLDPEAPPLESAALLGDELLGSDVEDQIAFRKNQRYVLRLIRKQASDAKQPPLKLRSNGTFLITGGLGGLGLKVAHWMVEKGARRLILMGRTQFPPRTLWSGVDPNTRLGAQINAIQRLESLGASVHLASVDVSDESQLRAFLGSFQLEGWPQICGVVHAAGVMQYQSLLDHDVAQMTSILRAKVYGGWLLHHLLGDQALDFFILFSSASSLLSSPLVTSYAAANAFLDCLAHYRIAQGQTALCINWGLWAEVGMAVNFEAGDHGSAMLHGVGTISTKQGLDALERLIRDGAGQAMVMPLDWRKWAQLYPAFTKAPLLTHLIGQESTNVLVDAESGTSTRTRLLTADPNEQAALVESYVTTQVSRVLGHPPSAVDKEEPLTHLGLDSLMAIELKNRIELDLQIVIPMVKLLQGPSVSDLTRQLVECLTASDSARTQPLVGSDGNDIDKEAAKGYLANLSELSDQDVDSLLEKMTTGKYVNKNQ